MSLSHFQKGYTSQYEHKLIEFLVDRSISDITVDYSETDTSELTQSIETRTASRTSEIGHYSRLFDEDVQSARNIAYEIIRITCKLNQGCF